MDNKYFEIEEKFKRLVSTTELKWSRSAQNRDTWRHIREAYQQKKKVNDDDDDDNNYDDDDKSA